MLSRVTTRKSGLADYLDKGRRADINLTRQERDNVVPLYGNLSTLKIAEDYCNENKNWSSNYEHITISFSDADIKILESMSENDQQRVYRDIAKTMIEHRTSGYDINNEVIAYAEKHEPKIKEEINGRTGEIQKGRTHIHIGISYLNPLSDTKLQTTFYNNSYVSDAIDKYISKKHGLTTPVIKSHGDINSQSKMSINRTALNEAIKDFSTTSELYKYLDENNIKYDFTNKKSKTKQSNLYVYNNEGGKIHLRGKDFANVEIMMNPNYNDKEKISHIAELKSKSLTELKDTLDKYYKTVRIPQIDKRRSDETKELLSNIHKQKDLIHNDKVNYISSLQENEKITLSLQSAEARTSERPKTITQHLARENIEKREIKNIPAENIANIKKNLDAKMVLNHAVSKYKLDISQYEVTNDNKINNKSNMQKPKNTIDFLQTEVKLTTKEAIGECQTLYAQPIAIVRNERQQEQRRQEPIARVNTNALYEKYKSEQAAKETAQKPIMDRLRQQKTKQIETVHGFGRVTRASIKLMKKSGESKKKLYEVTHTAMTAKIQEINTQYQQARQKCYDAHKRVTWADWLKNEALKGNAAATRQPATRQHRKPPVASVGTAPPPQSQNRLRTLLQLSGVGEQSPQREQPAQPSAERKPTPEELATVNKYTPEELDAVNKYITEREDKRIRGGDVSKHAHYTPGEGKLSFVGTRNVNGQPLALVKRGGDVLVIPTDPTTAHRLQKIPVGNSVSIAPNGSIKTSRGRGISR